MFELSASMEWTRLEQTLQIGHYAPLAIPTPDDLAKEVKTKKKSNKNHGDKNHDKWQMKGDSRGRIRKYFWTCV